MKDLDQILKLPASERLQLIEAIWDSLVEAPDQIPVTDAMREELDRRLAAYHEDPSSARPWDEVRAELFGKK